MNSSHMLLKVALGRELLSTMITPESRQVHVLLKVSSDSGEVCVFFATDFTVFRMVYTNILTIFVSGVEFYS